MLHRLEIENFYSIRDPEVVDLVASGHVAHAPGRLAPLWEGAAELAPKVVAIFGANASGKTNILRALSFIAWFVRDSFLLGREQRLPFQKFATTEYLDAPTRLSVHLAGVEDVARAGEPGAPQCRYAYEVVFGGRDRPVVQAEALFYWPSSATRRVNLFKRDASGKVTANKAFGLAGFGPALDKVLRPDVSVISTLAHLEHPFSSMVREAARSVVTNVLVDRIESPEDQIIQHYAHHPHLVDRLNQELERFDLGIQGMQIEPLAGGPMAFFRHEGLHLKMPLASESHGTRQFVRLFPLILTALDTGGIAVLDELDAAIHPLVLPEILRWFHDPERNPDNAQLWMTCHNASLLDELTKEEIVLCSKSSGGHTSVYGLSEVASVRRNDNYHRKYLSGTFGAVPRLG